MTSKLLLISYLVGSVTLLTGQTTLNIKVNTALDDHEERTTGAVPQTGTTGNMYPGSTSLEFGYETGTSDPVLTGFRFTNVTIPKFATIMSAYIQFTVKGISKNADPCSLTISAENNANPATFSDNPMSLSSRQLASGSIVWNVSGSTWGTIGSAGPDQRTSDLKSLIQPLVYNNNWVSGNAMAFFIKGTGSREVVSFEGDPTKVAELVVTYSVAGTNPTGLPELSNTSAVHVYPNPFKSSFTMNVDVASISDVNISVYDLTGKLVEEKSVKQAGAGTFRYISTAELNPGMYFVKVQANGKQEILKLISE